MKNILNITQHYSFFQKLSIFYKKHFRISSNVFKYQYLIYLRHLLDKNINFTKLQKCVYIDVQQPLLLSTTRAQLFSLVATNLNCLPKAPLKNKLPKHDLHHQIQLIYIRNKNLQEMIELRLTERIYFFKKWILNKAHLNFAVGNCQQLGSQKTR